MWFIFPQLAELGRSPTAKFFGIASLDEAGPISITRCSERGFVMLSMPFCRGPSSEAPSRSSATSIR